MEMAQEEYFDTEVLAEKIAFALTRLLCLDFRATMHKSTQAELNDLIGVLAINEACYYLTIVSKLSKGADALFLIVMDMASGDELLCFLTGKHIRIINEFEESALQEIANIIVGIFTSELGNSLKIPIEYAIPKVSIQTPGTILEFLAGMMYSYKLNVTTFTLISEVPEIKMKAAVLSPTGKWLRCSN